ncbi:dTDP-4-amino-4,6-dideoxy-D-glucose transaminase [uncultured bacterium]|nr:dTDP-4-amino-4,6-dideoxy-D-glucose transaminase [uncultured bacterium]
MLDAIKEFDDLAVFSGKPAFSEKLHVGRPNIGDRNGLMEKINDVLDRRWLTNNGKYVQELERRLADLLGVRHCIAMCNATVALEITTRALGLKGEVIVPSFTFIATAHSLQWQEITPVFCDVDRETYNIDPACVEKMITPRTSGIIGVHLWGRPCDTDALRSIARRHNVKLLFDAAHAFGCSHNGQMIGGFGTAEVFSFHATKFFNTLEGGAVATNDDELAAKIRLMKNFGFAGYDNVVYIGTNGKMDEISAAMGLTGLESLDEFIAVNKRNYRKYKEEFASVSGIELVSYDEHEKNNYQYVVCEIDEQMCGVSRDNLMKVLHAENIIARRYFYPGCHRMEPYRSYFPHAGLLLPNTELLSGKVLSLPTGTAVSVEEIGKICRVIELAADNGPEVTKRLAAMEPDRIRV